jgi:hypothetical protein
LITSYSLIAQTVEDTIYFDEDWSICEKPVAAYYRVSTLNRVNNIFYTGPTRDYYINGVLEMAGQYDKNGWKQGEFEFYDQQGKVIKEGTYVDDVMNGDWSYFDDSENLKAKFYCKTETDFTPIILITNSGDTLVWNGTGKFSFDTQKDLPNIFPTSCKYKVKGEVLLGLKEGTFTYTKLSGDKEFKRTEIYQNGVFERGKDFSVATGNVTVDKPFTFLDLSDNKLEKIDSFYHSNIVFGLGEEGDKKLIDFLLNKVSPQIISTSNSFEENSKDIFIILREVFRKYIKLPEAQYVNFSYPPATERCNLLSFSLPVERYDSTFNIHCNCVFTIDTFGYVIHSSFEGNLPKTQIGKINYYLSRLSHLMPYREGDEKTLSNIKINISTTIDTIKNEGKASEINYYYSAVNTSY